MIDPRHHDLSRLSPSERMEALDLAEDFARAPYSVPLSRLNTLLGRATRPEMAARVRRPAVINTRRPRETWADDNELRQALEGRR